MELYYIIFSLVLLSCIFEKAQTLTKKRVLIFWCIFFILFGGLRWRTGGDWEQYYGHFLFSSWENIFNYDRYGDGRDILEPGFVFLNVLIKTIFGEFYIYNLIICSFIQYTYCRLSYKFAPNYPILMYAYLTINATNYFPVRAGLSLAIAFWAYKYIKEQNLMGFLIVVAIATLIHNQCIILLPFYWAGKLKFNYITFTILYVIVAVCGYIFQDYFITIAASMGGSLAEKAYNYTQFQTLGRGDINYMSWGLNYVLVMIYIYYRKKFKSNDDLWVNALIVMSAVHSFIFIVFSDGMGDLTRLATLFILAKAILFVQCFTTLAKSKSFVLKAFSISFIVLFMIYRMTEIYDWYFFEAANVPYKTVFNYNML